jgi:hypothetical protein
MRWDGHPRGRISAADLDKIATKAVLDLLPYIIADDHL